MASLVFHKRSHHGRGGQKYRTVTGRLGRRKSPILMFPTTKAEGREGVGMVG